MGKQKKPYEVIYEKPMLACSVKPEDLDKLRYPVLTQPKLDGIRCVMTPDGLRTRTNKPIPNKDINALLANYSYMAHERGIQPGSDMELIAKAPFPGSDIFSTTQSIVMSEYCDSSGLINAHIFDVMGPEGAFERHQRIDKESFHTGCVTVPSYSCFDAVDVMQQYEHWVEKGYEGLMIRGYDAPYKHGRGTKRDQCLMKLKPRDDSEAVVTGFTQRVRETGPVPEIGAIEADWNGVSIRVGTGFTVEWARHFWRRPELLVGRTITFFYQGVGNNGLPRFPAFKSFREDV